jgi:hypothetical protein
MLIKDGDKAREQRRLIAKEFGGYDGSPEHREAAETVYRTVKETIREMNKYDEKGNRR